MTAGEEVVLARRIRKGDLDARRKLVEANLRFVITVAREYQNQGVPLADLISAGNLGLITAAERFDETRGFSSSPTRSGGFVSPSCKPSRNIPGSCAFR